MLSLSRLYLPPSLPPSLSSQVNIGPLSVRVQDFTGDCVLHLPSRWVDLTQPLAGKVVLRYALLCRWFVTFRGVLCSL